MSLRSMCCSMLTITALLSAQITPGQGYGRAKFADDLRLQQRIRSAGNCFGETSFKTALSREIFARACGG